MISYIWLILSTAIFVANCSAQETKSQCDAEYLPENCNLQNLKLSDLATVEDFERCGPALLNKNARNYFWAGAGREITYRDNRDAFKRIKIIPQILRDVSKSHTTTYVLGQKLAFPIGVSPMAVQSLVNPLGEIATARAATDMGTIMILSGLASTTIEKIGTSALPTGHLWMQTYFFKNRAQTVDIVKRAEKAGFKAVVVTADSPVEGTLTCAARDVLEYPLGTDTVNLFNQTFDPSLLDSSVTFNDITWLKKVTKLPIVIKGVLSGPDARRAALSGASAILVSNHGGRQLDSVPASIDALPGVVDALQDMPMIDVFLDGGVRNGYDVYKALARGAKAVFVGRPIIWGMAVAGETGIRKVLDIMKNEFNETMRIAGVNEPKAIPKSSLYPSNPPLYLKDSAEHGIRRGR